MFSIFGVNSYAETLDSSTFDYKCTQFYNDDRAVDITNDITVFEFTEDEGERIVRFEMPGNSDLQFQLLVAYSLSNLKVGHEYEMSFGYALGHGSASEFILNLVFYDGNGKIVKTQELYKNPPNKLNQIKHINLSFIPDSSGVTSGYYTELQFKFYSNTVYSNTAKLTKEITVKDINDNMGLIEGIIDWVKHIYYGLVGGTCDCGKAYDGVVQGIKNGLVSLGSTISTAIDKISGWLYDVKIGITNALASVRDSINEKIEGIQVWFINLKNGIIDGLKSLFIPSDDYFEGYKNKWMTFAEEHLGLVYQVTDITVTLVKQVQNIMLSDSYIFTFPAIKVPINGKTYTFLEEQQVNIDMWIKGNGGSAAPAGLLYDVYTVCVWALFVFALVKYATKVEGNIFGVGGDEE